MATDVRTTWEGHYFDGRSADRRRVAVTIAPEGIVLAADGGAPVVWPFAEVRQTQGAQPGEPVRLERGGALPEVVVVRDPAFLAALEALAPRMRGRLAAPRARSARAAMVAGSAVGAVAAGLVLYLWVLPFVAEVAADHVPRAWEEELGRAVVEGGGLGALRRCDEAAGLAALDRIVSTLTAATPGRGYTYRVAVVEMNDVNALAASGGYVVVFDGLLQRAGSPEELAGVLAHEMQHVEQRHLTRMLLREVSAAALLTAATGDATQFATVLAAAQGLGQLHFSRAAEASADAGGMRAILAARIDPAGMVRFMRRLDDDREEVPAAFKYLSTHPMTDDRVAALERLAREAAYQPITLLSPAEWQALKAICRTGRRGARPATDGPRAPDTGGHR